MICIYYYNIHIINALRIHKLEKYEDILDLRAKIFTFLTQEKLFAWEVEW